MSGLLVMKLQKSTLLTHQNQKKKVEYFEKRNTFEEHNLDFLTGDFSENKK